MITLSVFVIVAYAAACALYVRQVLINGTRVNVLDSLVYLVSLGLHAILCIVAIHDEQGAHFSISNLLLVVSLGMSSVVYSLNLFVPNHPLALVVIGLAILATLTSAIGLPVSQITITTDGWVFTHITLSVISYTVLGVAAFQSLLFTSLQRWLQNPEQLQLATHLPPLDQMGRINIRLLGTGVAVLGVTIVLGFIKYWDRLTIFDYQVHMWFAVAAWVIYGGVIALYLVRKSYSHLMSWISCIAFALLLMSYLGYRTLGT